jgi:hypothetical protein
MPDDESMASLWFMVYGLGFRVYMPDDESIAHPERGAVPDDALVHVQTRVVLNLV